MTTVQEALVELELYATTWKTEWDICVLTSRTQVVLLIRDQLTYMIKVTKQTNKPEVI